VVSGKTVDRRNSVRRPIRLDAILQIGEGEWPCEIADFCAEGLFLRYSSDVAGRIQPLFARSSPLVSVRFFEPDARKEFSLQARPVRRIDGAMGVEFTQSNPQAIEALLSQCLAGSGSFQPSPKGPEQGGFILRQCTRATAQFVEPLVAEWFKEVDRQLQASAQQVNDQLAQELMDAAMALPKYQRPFWQTMNRAIETPQARPEQGEQSKSKLDLVDKGVFEDWLLLRVMVSKAETQFRGPLLQLKMRLAKANVGINSGHQNPLGPILVCDAFRQAQENLGFSRAVDKIAFRVFEQEVVKNLEPLYTALNQIFIRHGILPDLDLSKFLSEQNPGKANAAPTEKPRLAASQPALQAVPGNARDKVDGAVAKQDPEPGRSRRKPADAAFRQSNETAVSAFATVRRLLSTLKNGRSPEGAASSLTDSTAIPLSNDEFHHELGAIAVSAQERTEIVAGEMKSLRARVEARMAALEARRLAPEQEETLDVVDQFLMSVEQSPRLSETSRAQLHQLGIPVLQAALQGKGAFDDDDNAVRGVLNRIAQLGPRGGRPNPVLQRRVEGIIEKINTGYASDPGVFDEALTELDELVARQNLAYRRNVERVTAAAEGAQKVEDARSAVGQALERLVGDQPVPRALVTLLNEGWRDLLTLTHVRQGPDSSAWQSYLLVVDTLMAFSRDPTMPVDLRELLRIIQEGLASISSNQKPAAQIREGLKHFLTGRDSPASELIKMPAVAKAADPAGMGDRRRKSLQRWINRARELKLGDWMKYQEDPENPSYMRLVWMGRDGSRFVFVNHQGMKLVEFDLVKMADHLQKGIVVHDPDFERPIVDESIDRMVRQVYEQASLASTRDELTGLNTRREFERCLGEHLAIAAVVDPREQPAQKALVVLELQYLRELSDTAGFESGDEALRRVAELLGTHVPENSHLARLGGPRFGFLLTAEDVDQQVNGLIGVVKTLPLHFAGQDYRLSANAGIAVDQPGLASAEQWLASVEDGLVRCRKDGREAVLWHAPVEVENPRDEKLIAKFTSVEDLARERILLRSQKILPLHGETRLGVQHQVLYSMYDESGQLIHGSEFSRIAERHSRIQTVDRWLIGHLLDWMSCHPKKLEDLGSLGVSLSASSLADAALLEVIFETMSQKDAPIEHLWFEITEAAARAHPENTASFMAEMSELGCHFCLSQFYGRSESYDLLKQLPVARVKIDGSFILELLQDRNDQALVRSMIDMTHFLGREIIAGQVEDRAAVDLLVEMGMDYAQGGAIERPVSFED